MKLTTNREVLITKKTILYLRYLFEGFDIDLFKVNFHEKVGINILYSYSFDGQNFSNAVRKEDFQIDSSYKDVYIAVVFIPENPNENTEAEILYVEQNVDPTIQHIILKDITYGENMRFDLTKSDDVRFLYFENITNRYPKWNFYDGQVVNVNRWLDQCDAINEMYGHTCIYFKTEPVESDTSYTLANHVIRNVVAIKKIKINVPNNELPQDRSAYTDWDYMLPDDFVVHVINRKFKIAFGEDKVPLSKDYLYLPITGKLYRVNSVQAKNGFMNKIGWWECFLTKYEEDECVVMSDEIRAAMEDNTVDEDMDMLLESLESIDKTSENVPVEVINELEELKQETLYTSEKVNKETINEKKEATQWFTNKDYDSTWYVSLKETEHQREMINRRIKIVNVNPDDNAFPVTMYDCSTVIEKNIGLVYDLKDYTSVNKQSTALKSQKDKIQFSFNFVLLSTFTGEIFRFVDEKANAFFTLKQERKNTKFEYSNGEINKEFTLNYQFEPNEFYNVTLQLNKRQLAVIVFKLANKQKTFVHQDLYAIDDESGTEIDAYKLLLYGGKFYSGDIYLYINDLVIMKDNVNPVLIMNNF